MALVTLRPIGIMDPGSWTVSGAASLNAAVASNSDGDSISKGAGAGTKCLLNVGTTVAPANAFIKAITARVRWQGTSASDLELGITGRGPKAAYWGIGPHSIMSFPSATFATQTGVTAPAIFNDIQAIVDNLAIYVISDGASLVTELYLDVDFNLPPVVSAVTVTGYATTTKPTTTWTYTDPESDVQRCYVTKAFTAAQYGAGGFNPEYSVAAWNSGVTVSGAATAVSADLANGTTYKIYVKCSDIIGPAGEQRYSAWEASAAFTVTANLPLPILMTSSVAAGQESRIDITTTSQTGGAVPAQTYALQRSYDNGVTWEAVFGAQSLAVVAGAVAVFNDYTSRPNSSVVYRAQAIGTAAGLPLPSLWSTTSAPVIPMATDFWLKNPVASAQNIRLHIAGDLDLTQEETQGLFRPLGRNRAVVISGDIYGESFDLPLAFYSEADYLAFEALRKVQTTLLLQSDMTQQWWIRLGASRRARLVNRIGRKATPYRQVQVSAVEVDGV